MRSVNFSHYFLKSCQLTSGYFNMIPYHVASGHQYDNNLQYLLKVSVLTYIIDNNSSTSIRNNFGHMCITNLVIGNPTTCVYPFIINYYCQHSLVILQLFILDVFILWYNLNYHIAHMLYSWTLSNWNDVPLILVKDKYYICSDYDKTFFGNNSFKLWHFFTDISSWKIRLFIIGFLPWLYVVFFILLFCLLCII